MKMSEALLIGSTLLKPVPYMRTDDKGGGCALGMALTAIGENPNTTFSSWNWVTNPAPPSPCGCTTFKQYANSKDETKTIHPINHIVSVIVHLFNEHVCEKGDWTIEQLADYIKSVEPAEAAPQAEATEKEVVVTAEP